MSEKIKNDVHSFEEDLKKIEDIVSCLESGELPLEKALDMFERGIQLIRKSQKKLEKAEQRVKILLNDEENEKLTVFSPKEK